MGSFEPSQGTNKFVNEVTARFGVLPNFFLSAPAAVGLVEELWAFAKSGYLDNPLPSLFKERLFVHLSRFCEVRYCIVRHVGFLLGEGRPAGDPVATPHTLEQSLALLRRPVPDAAALDQVFTRLEAHAQPGDLPLIETQAEADLFDALTGIFLQPQRSARARDAVRKAIGERYFELLAAFLAFVHTAHYWTETHPELAYEPDMLSCMEHHPELAHLLLDATDAEAAKGSAQLRQALSGLQQTEGALRRSEAWLVGQKEAFQAAMNGAPLEASLAILIDTAIQQAESARRCAFYIADAEGKTLRHVVGMPDAYARCVNGFEISPASLACGLAIAKGEPVVTADVQEEPRWEPWLWMARQFDFRGCWSFPIETASGRFVGTFAMYFREPREPTPLDRELAAALTHTAAIIISRHHETEERRQAGEALCASEERLRQFGDASSDVLWIRDAEGLQWAYLTPAFEQIYGLGREAALQGDNLAGWLELIVPEDRERVLDAIQRVRAGERVTFECRIRRPCDGTVRWLRDTDFPMDDPAGQICWIGGSAETSPRRKRRLSARRCWSRSCSIARATCLPWSHRSPSAPSARARRWRALPPG
ncbi:GAF domain-containing protein [Methylobacterium sp. P31]